MREVTKEEFYATIGKLDCHPTPEGTYPYVSYFKLRDRTVVGKAVDEQVAGRIETRYYLP